MRLKEFETSGRVDFCKRATNFTDLESSFHGKKNVGTLVSKREDEGKTFPCEILHIFMRNICNLDVKIQSRNTIHKRMSGVKWGKLT